MLTLNDGRNELWQWDTGRKLTVDAECSQVHFSNKVFGRSIDIDVIDGVVTIPDILLQTDKDLNVWAFVGTAENGYTKISKVFKVNRRNKPADYVFTPPEQTTLAEIMERIEDLEEIQDPDAIKDAVNDYLDNNPILVEEKDPTVPQWAKQREKPTYTASEVGAISQDDLQNATNEALEQAKESGEFDGEDGYTPIRGVDYYTEDDKNEIVERVFDAICAEDTDAKYFSIDLDGVVCLAPAYRGSCPSNRVDSFPCAVSDMGAGKNGSKNGELPKNIVIPEMIGDIAVSALAPGMFYQNKQVESVKIPIYIREIPERFADNATNLHYVTGTENVTKIGNCAFQTSGLRKAYFPNLEEMVNVTFSFCEYLTVADIGDKITTLPRRSFFCNSNLSCVHGGKSVTSVGEQAFGRAYKLKNLSFLPNLKSIGKWCFRRSRVAYDWQKLKDGGCTFGEYATSLQLHPTDFWTANKSNIVPCETPIVSCFSQEDPRWKDIVIGTYSGTITSGSYTGPLTYQYGCFTFCSLACYSALSGETFNTPMEYVDKIAAINPDLVSKRSSVDTTQRTWLDALGYEMSDAISYNEAGLKRLYEALVAGHMVITECITEELLGNHVCVIHGVNEIGELMCVNSHPSGVVKFTGEYKADRYTIPVQNLVQTIVSPVNKFYIVKEK